ncbi:MAG: cob(I)yrinic acid a,c-diamide adenosyltransferase [bacterium]
MKGYTQVYTGNGKGKTTAAVGLTVRAAGAGLRVYFGQFLKAGDSAEMCAISKHLACVTVESFGDGRFVRGAPTRKCVAAVARGLDRISLALSSRKYDVVVADEINVAVALGLLQLENVLDLVRNKPANVELVLTGRGADRRLRRLADLVTDFRCAKHYYCTGVTARKGIER